METNRQNIAEIEIAEEFEIGREFGNIQEFSDAFSISAMQKGIMFFVKQRNKTSITLFCKEPECTFKVIARNKIITSKCTVRHMNPIHSCVGDGTGIRRQTKSIKRVIKTAGLPGITPQNLMAKFRTEFQCDVLYSTAWSAIKTAKESAEIVLENSYEFLPSLTEKIRARGDIANYECASNGEFRRFFLMWNASIHFFGSSRKLLYLDGTFLAGTNKGTLLVAVSQDGCDQLVLIAIAIVESENSESWNWFVHNINSNMNINHLSVIVMSDREKGIINAVNTVIPLCSKAFCLRHIGSNLRIAFRDQAALGLYWSAANTYSIEEFNRKMNLLCNLNQPCHQRLIDIGVDKWANSMFPVPRFGKNTNNPAESLNSALKQFISNDITNLIISINNYTMIKFNERRQKRFRGLIVDKYQKILSEKIREGASLTNVQSSSTIYLVDQIHEVNLANKTCDCNEGKDMGIPCMHICSVLQKNHINPISFISKVYLTETYNNQFAHNILPLTSKNLLRSNVLPPLTRRARGRPRTRRIRASFER